MQRRHCLSGIVSAAADNIAQKVDSDDGPARKRRKLSSLSETQKVPSVAEHLTYASPSEPRPCNSHQTAALPPRQPAALPPCQSVSLPPPIQPRASVLPARTSQHLLRTRRSSPAALIQHSGTSSADVLRLHHDVVSSRRSDDGVARHMSSSDATTSQTSRTTLLTRSHSDVSRDRLMSTTADNRQLPLDTHRLQQQQYHHHHYQRAAPMLPESVISPSTVYPAMAPPAHPTYFPLPLNHPLTAADLAHYLAAPTAPVSAPYLVRPSPPSWPVQTGINVVPAAVLAADVLPEYYYGLGHDGLAAYPPAAFHPLHQQQQQQQYACRRGSSVPHHVSRPADDDASYSERHRNLSTENASSFHMTQLPHDMTQIPRAAPLLYPGDQRASTSVGSRQHFDDMDVFTTPLTDARDWSTLTRSAERAQPLFVHHFLSVLERTLGAVHDSPQHLPYAASHFRNYEALLGLARQLSESKPKGLSKADIDRLASFQFTAATTNHLSDAADSDGAVKQSGGGGAVTQTSCVVCMSEFVNRQRIRELPCQHIFHLKCIDKWLKTTRTCPLCRADVLDLLNSDTKPFIR